MRKSTKKSPPTLASQAPGCHNPGVIDKNIRMVRWGFGIAGLMLLGSAVNACGSAAAEDDDTSTSTSNSTSSGNQGECVDNAGCVGNASGPVCDLTLNLCASVPPGGTIGWGDGSTNSVDYTFIFSPDTPKEITDIAFHPERPNELWVLHREFPNGEPCDENNATAAGCQNLEGSVTVVWNPGEAMAQSQLYVDPNAWHFMRRPSAFAFGATGTFATSAEARTGNYLDSNADFIGPSLWSSDLAVFAVQPPGLNGSHLDMLHASPLTMGIAHETGNVYWVLNGGIGSLDRYDFAADHGPGHDDHSDGGILRYATGAFTRMANIPGHMKFHDADKSLYIADPSGGRVVKLDTQSGTATSTPITPNYENLTNTAVVDGAVLTDVVPPGVLTTPSGLLIHDDVLYVTDTATSMVHAFTLDGTLLRSLDVNVAPNTLGAFTIDRDNQAYFADRNGVVYRIDPR